MKELLNAYNFAKRAFSDLKTANHSVLLGHKDGFSNVEICRALGIFLRSEFGHLSRTYFQNTSRMNSSRRDSFSRQEN